MDFTFTFFTNSPWTAYVAQSIICFHRLLLQLSSTHGTVRFKSYRLSHHYLSVSPDVLPISTCLRPVIAFLRSFPSLFVQRNDFRCLSTNCWIANYRLLWRLAVLISSFDVFWSSSFTCNSFDGFRFWLFCTKIEAMMSFFSEKNLHHQPWVNLKAVFWQGNSEGILWHPHFSRP